MENTKNIKNKAITGTEENKAIKKLRKDLKDKISKNNELEEEVKKLRIDLSESNKEHQRAKIIIEERDNTIIELNEQNDACYEEIEVLKKGDKSIIESVSVQYIKDCMGIEKGHKCKMERRDVDMMSAKGYVKIVK